MALVYAVLIRKTCRPVGNIFPWNFIPLQNFARWFRVRPDDPELAVDVETAEMTPDTSWIDKQQKLGL